VDWRHEAECARKDADGRSVYDSELWFPIGNTGPAILQIEQAKAVCRRCDVVETCLRWALETGQDAGVAGGTSEDERRALKRRESRARARDGEPKPARRNDYVDAAECRRLIEDAMRVDGDLSIREVRRRTGISHETLSAILDGERGGEPTRVLPGTEQRLRFALSAVTA
jgi:WhiB family transcriptional regulator, redox-sensing transcriptional regulator